MKHALLALAAVLLIYPGSKAQGELPLTGEELNYTVNWPSGLNLGEAQLKASRAVGATGEPGRWDWRLRLDAAIPGFIVADQFRSAATDEFCSQEFEKETAHGKRTGKEKVTFNQAEGSARRETLDGGGVSQLQITPCAKDALAFLYYLLQELAQGRLPAAQNAIFGGEYLLRLQHAGREQITIAGQQFTADRITAAAKGTASETTMEIYFAQDEARRPLLIRFPTPLGTFSLELVP
jgi:hypothetical protein